MKNDTTLDIAVGVSVRSKNWKNKKIKWSQFAHRLSESVTTNETFKEYVAAGKEEQLRIKDVGGYVGGYLRGGKRNPDNVVYRQVMTLDMDFAHNDFWDDFCLQFENAAVIHSTHKHHKKSPRYRLIIPVSREMTPDEYVAVSRKIAGDLDIELFDNTTFETNRLMFWPSNPKDIEYYYRYQDGPFIDVDEVLNTYYDWTDSSLWPIADAQLHRVRSVMEKQQDPENKKGIIGAFCRTHSITESIEKFLSDEYEEAINGRYTYTKGTTSGGLMVYDDKFAYSHHGTDPCGGKLSNSFDLVRIHKFGHLDSDLNNKKSFQAMQEFARKDVEVKKVIAVESLDSAKYDFAEELEIQETDIDWMAKLDTDAKGKYVSSATNISLIFANDIRLKGLFKNNEFDGKRYICGNMPWRKVPGDEPMKNVDYSGVRNYLESLYGITGNLKIDDSLALEFEKNKFHPIQEYLRGLKWDGEERVDRLLIDYFGAEDNGYTREAMRKTLIGAVGRVMVPGIKFDLVLTLVGDQGCGKSTFASKLGGPWFSDTFMTVTGKEAFEQVQGAWVIEMAELSGTKKAGIESVKHFISKQEDTFRPAYARTSETFRRQCIFIATTNKKDFLRDPTGNRRFMPVDMDVRNAVLSVFDDLTPEEVDQIWAEAMKYYKDGESLFLSKEAEAIAALEQKAHSETDERKGLIEKYLNTLLPKDWAERTLYERREYLNDPLSPNGVNPREVVCVAEVWCECLGKEKEDMDRYKTGGINDILKSLEDWQQSNSTKNFAIYGKQKYYSNELY